VINDLSSQNQENRNDIFPTWDAFLYVDDTAVSSLFSPSSGQIPFVHAVGYYSEGSYEDDPMDPEGHYKIAIELLGHFWCLVGTGALGMDEMGPGEVGGVCTVVGVEGLWIDKVIGKVEEELLK
jgi:hypothetical protein